MTPPTTGLVVAAGTGRRLGFGMPKAFSLLAGEPLFVHAVRALVLSGVVDETVLVVAGADIARAEEALGVAGLVVRQVCAGGQSRQESVALGLASCPPGGVVAVHDAARPLASPELVARTVAAFVQPWAGVAPGLPLVDTIKVVDEVSDQVLHTVDRSRLWAVQTPQVFAHDTLVAAHATAQKDPSEGATDDLVLVERVGGPVRIVAGERTNLKVTFPDDLGIAAALLAARDWRSAAGAQQERRS